MAAMITILARIPKAFVLAGLLALTVVGKSDAQNEAMPSYNVSPAPNLTPVYSIINGPVGWTFQPTTDISVTALGVFAGLPSNLEVGLWNSSGDLLASSTIGSDATAFDQSLYESITPVSLMANQTYYLAAFSSSGAFQAVTLSPNFAPPDGNAIMSPYIQLGSVATENGGVFQFPDMVQGPNDAAIIAANFEFQPVPEPATFSLLGVGSLAWLAKRRKISS
jgi:hypothetical protein